MKFRSTAAFAVLASVCTLAIGQASTNTWLKPQVPAPVPVQSTTNDETPQLWFVELKGAPVADGNSLNSVRAEKQAFRSAAKAAGLQYKERYAYDTLFNGFSVSVSRTQLSKLSRLPDVKSIHMVNTIPMPVTTKASPELFTAITMTGADIAQNELGLTGAGVKVAVMDTGIDIDHPDFGGNGSNHSTPFPTGRVITGWDFVGDAYDAGTNPNPVPDANPDDCAGHGTHVAGIIGANGAVKGVAPGVKFGAYRVFGCAGSTSDDVMIAAMERALADKMQVLNMSIGEAFTWPDSPTAKAATRLVNKGMVVVASIGNSGANGLYSAGAPGLGDKVIGVASFDNIAVRQSAFSLGPDGTLVGFSTATAAPAPPTSGTFAMARTGTTSTTNDACNAVAPAPGSLTGQVVLIRRGTCSFYEKANNAQNAGAAGVVLYNNTAGFVSPTVAGATPINIPVVMVTSSAGALIDSRISSGGVDMTWGTQTTSTPDSNGGLISSFSSYGLSPDLALKPDIGAPGGNIYSTFPLELGGYASLSGTSMASPHVAGTAALLLQAAPKTSASSVRDILENTARPKAWWGNPGLGFLDNVHRQGAGMVRIDDAILTATRVTPGKLSLGESQAGPVAATLTLRNTGSTVVNYTVSSVNALATGPNTFSVAFGTSNNSVAFDTANVIVPPGASATVNATVTPPTNLPQGSIYGGYLVFTPDDGSATLRVPYAGYVGDYQARQVLTPTANGFPWLAKFTGSSYANQPGGATYTMAGNDIPFFLMHLDHQSRQLQLRVFSVAGKDWHLAFQEDFLPRNSTGTGFFAFSWDGVTTAGGKSYTVPNGTYVVQLTVLKALGSASIPADTETWSSPVITIAR